MSRPSTSTQHGTVAGYRKCKPICDECRAAWNDYHRKYQRAARASFTSGGDPETRRRAHFETTSEIFIEEQRRRVARQLREQHGVET